MSNLKVFVSTTFGAHCGNCESDLNMHSLLARNPKKKSELAGLAMVDDRVACVHGGDAC